MAPGFPPGTWSDLPPEDVRMIFVPLDTSHEVFKTHFLRPDYLEERGACTWLELVSRWLRPGGIGHARSWGGGELVDDDCNESPRRPQVSSGDTCPGPTGLSQSFLGAPQTEKVVDWRTVESSGVKNLR